MKKKINKKKEHNNISYFDVLFAGHFEKSFELRHNYGLNNIYAVNDYIQLLDNPHLNNMCFIDQFDEDEITDDIYIDGIEVMNRIENELRTINNNDDEDSFENLGKVISQAISACMK